MRQSAELVLKSKSWWEHAVQWKLNRAGNTFVICPANSVLSFYSIAIRNKLPCRESRQWCAAGLGDMVKFITKWDKWRFPSHGGQCAVHRHSVSMFCGSCFYLPKRVRIYSNRTFVCLYGAHYSWVILEIPEFMACTGEIIFHKISGLASLQTFGATHIAHIPLPAQLPNTDHLVFLNYPCP